MTLDDALNLCYNYTRKIRIIQRATCSPHVVFAFQGSFDHNKEEFQLKEDSGQTIEKKLVQMKVADLIPYERNPRKIPREAVDAVRESYRQCGVIDPIEIDENNIILSGHTRRLAAIEEKLEIVDVLLVTGLTEPQKKKYRILANKTGEKSGWDYELLTLEIAELDFEGYDFEWDIPGEDGTAGDWEDIGQKGSLVARYVVPPFTVLNAGAKYWQDRKKEWLRFIHSDTGRSNTLLSEGLLRLAKKTRSKKITGSSIFDPVLTEALEAWFCPAGGHVLDPFAGGSVRGLVSAFTGRDYTGIDLRQEQIDANEEDYLQNCGMDDFTGNHLRHPRWITGDSMNVRKLAGDKEYDFLLTCPPYHDLEKYSDDPHDLSNMDYETFRETYFTIIREAFGILKENAFAAIVVGEIRDKKGYQRNFVSDTIRAFTEAGAKYFSELVLCTCVGTAAVRASHSFSKGRKPIKIHQNVLVFVKGNEKKIQLGDYEYVFPEEELQNDVEEE